MTPGPFSFAHLTDPHLPLRSGDASWPALLGKRITGWLSWRMKRQDIHRPEVLAALIEDIRAHAPDHVVVTGDLVNISAAGEIARAGEWLAGLGAAGGVTAVPGNHDAYVRPRGGADFACWRDHMTDSAPLSARPQFPFVRRRGPAAFIGLNTAIPTAPFTAFGRLGAAQLAALDSVLTELGAQGVCRVLLLHHPPAGPDAEEWREGLHGHEDFARVLAARGAELVLHGHTHHWALRHLPGPGGTAIPVLSAGSASAFPVRGAEPASWNLIRVAGEPGAWRLSAGARGWTPQGFAPLRDVDLSAHPPPPLRHAARARLQA